MAGMINTTLVMQPCEVKGIIDEDTEGRKIHLSQPKARLTTRLLSQR